MLPRIVPSLYPDVLDSLHKHYYCGFPAQFLSRDVRLGIRTIEIAIGPNRHLIINIMKAGYGSLS